MTNASIEADVSALGPFSSILPAQHVQVTLLEERPDIFGCNGFKSEITLS